MKKILFALVVLFSGLSYADQCQWNSPSDAQSARDLVALHKEVMYWCQNCSEQKPSRIVKVEAVKIPVVNDEFNLGEGKKYRYVNLTTIVDGKEKTDNIDLAYTYVRTASDIFANIAQMVGCPSEGATTFIQTTNKNYKSEQF